MEQTSPAVLGPVEPSVRPGAEACACRECEGQGRYDRWLAVNGHYEGGEVFSIQCDACDGSGREKPVRESVADALLIVESYGPWGADLNDAHRRQIVLGDEVKRLRTALAKIADWDSNWGPFPENNEAWRAMAVVTAREAVPELGPNAGAKRQTTVPRRMSALSDQLGPTWRSRHEQL